MIVGATLAFREGELIKYCIDDLLKYCDYIVVVLDNYDKKTEDIVLNYKNEHGDRFIVAYSKIKRLLNENGRRDGTLKSRLNAKQGKIRQQVLDEVLKIHKKKNIELLIWLDADECFTDFFPQSLEMFLKSDKKILAIRPVTIYDNFKTVRSRTLIPHGKVFKYRPDMSAIGYHGRGFYLPFDRGEIMKAIYTLVHLPLLTKEYREFRKHYVGDRSDMSKKYFLFNLGKDVRRLSPQQITDLLKKPIGTIEEYENKRISN